MAHVTVPDEPTRVQFTVTTPASTGPFAFAFSYFDVNDIEVYNGTSLVAAADYTLTPTTTATGGYEGGSITLDVAVSNTTITVLRRVPIERETDFPTSGPFPINTLNSWIDKTYAILQQIATKLTRTVRVADTDTSVSLELPVAASRANKVLGFTSTGAVKVSTINIDDLDGLSDDATAAAASAAAALVSETNASASEVAAAASAVAAAAAAGSGLFSGIYDHAADFTITANTDNAKLFKVDSTGGNINVTLPDITVAEEGERYGFLRVTASNTITLVRHGTDTINGAAGNYTLAAIAGEITLIIADEATPDNWIVLPWAQSTADGTTLTKTGAVIALNLASDNTWTGSQRSTPVTDNDGSFDMDAGQDFVWTPSGADVLEFTNERSGQRGMILLVNPSAYAITFGSEIMIDSEAASALSTAGTYMLSYWCYDGTNVAVSYSAALS